ncbi:Peroxisomal leader peptide-processing protease [Bos mutus]|uniref:Peroxisomal leader peptide-processing protease n=1 Tax=Bos mutus TaxID=72004 RepID=L8I3Q5_9CETA|nr:Peroxisomal leader peptide-processing protease [Bos mutus]
MGRQWGPAMRAAEQAGCVVSASRAGQPEAGSWSCSGVILNRRPGLVLCHGGILTPFLRAGSGALTGPLQPPRPAELLLLLSCPAFRGHFVRLFGGEEAEQWRFANAAPDDEVSEEEEEDQLRALGWFALLRVRPEMEKEAEERGPVLAVAPLGDVPKGAPLLACGSPFGAFCPDIFLNTLSRGVLSNSAGPLLLTDARCLPGTEGGGVFASRPAGALVALVAAPLCWKAREWVGLTLLCAAAPLLSVARAALCRLHPDTAALAALLPPEMGAPWGLPLRYRDPGPPWAAAAVLVECGSVWGSGVAVAPHLVVTCRHVAPRETARVLVRSTTPKSAIIWGRVMFATQETSPYDIAVVRLEEDLDGVPVPVPAEHFHEGEAVSVVGFGVFGQACGPSVTSGILSAVVRVDDTPVMLQTTCAVHGGDPGDMMTKCHVGSWIRRRALVQTLVHPSIVASNTRDNNTGATYPHLNFSIPITVLQPALQQYSQTGDLGGFRQLDRASEPVRVVWRLQRPPAEALRSKL